MPNDNYKKDEPLRTDIEEVQCTWQHKEGICWDKHRRKTSRWWNLSTNEELEDISNKTEIV